MGRTLRVVAVLALVAWAALGALAWYRAASLQGEIRARQAQEGAGETALLAEQVEVLGADVDAIREGVNEGFGLLAKAIEEEGRRARAAAAQRAERATTPGVVPEPQPAEPPVELALVDEAAPDRSFLAFRLPKRELRFAGRQRFEVLSSLSRVGFDAESTLHDFTGACDSVTGSLTLDLADPAAGIAGTVEIRADCLQTGLEARDEDMREHLETGRFPRIAFEAGGFDAHVVDPEERHITGFVRGELSVHGRTRAITMPIEAHVDEARRLVIDGETLLLLSDYDVRVPSKAGVLSMDDEVRVWIHLRARARPSELEEPR